MEEIKLVLIGALLLIVPVCAQLILAFVKLQTEKIEAQIIEMRATQVEISSEVKIIGNGHLLERAENARTRETDSQGSE